MKKLLKWLREPLNHQVRYWEKIKYNNAWMTDFSMAQAKRWHCHWHWKVWCLSITFCFADCVAPGWRQEWWTENLKRKKRVISKEVVGISQDILNAILGLEIIKINKTGLYLANEAKICNKIEFACKEAVIRIDQLPTSALRNVHVITQKLNLDQNINSAYTCWKTLILI